MDANIDTLQPLHWYPPDVAASESPDASVRESQDAPVQEPQDTPVGESLAEDLELRARQDAALKRYRDAKAKKARRSKVPTFHLPATPSCSILTRSPLGPVSLPPAPPAGVEEEGARPQPGRHSPGRGV